MQRRAKEDLSGWFMSPEKDFCCQFHIDPKSWNRYPYVFIDRWDAQPYGTPYQMRSRNKLPLDEALELCTKLILDGWERLIAISW